MVQIIHGEGIYTDTFELKSKSLFSRTVVFESLKWGRFQWRYASRKEKGKDVNCLLILEKIGDGLDGNVVVARLVRCEKTRTPGTKACFAGNGGRLEMCLRREDCDGKEEVLDEATNVATCCVMLKKEIDRLRAVQIMCISAAGAGS